MLTAIISEAMPEAVAVSLKAGTDLTAAAPMPPWSKQSRKAGHQQEIDAALTGA